MIAVLLFISLSSNLLSSFTGICEDLLLPCTSVAENSALFLLLKSKQKKRGDVISPQDFYLSNASKLELVILLYDNQPCFFSLPSP